MLALQQVPPDLGGWRIGSSDHHSLAAWKCVPGQRCCLRPSGPALSWPGHRRPVASGAAWEFSGSLPSSFVSLAFICFQDKRFATETRDHLKSLVIWSLKSTEFVGTFVSFGVPLANFSWFIFGLPLQVALQLRSAAFRQNRCSTMRTGPNPAWLREAVVDGLQRELFTETSRWQLPSMGDFDDGKGEKIAVAVSFFFYLRNDKHDVLPNNAPRERAKIFISLWEMISRSGCIGSLVFNGTVSAVDTGWLNVFL